MLPTILLAIFLNSALSVPIKPCLPSATNDECLAFSDIQKMMREDPDLPDQPFKATPKTQKEETRI